MAESTVKGFIDRGEPEYLPVAARKIALGTLLAALLGPRSVDTAVTVYADESEEVDGIVTAVHATAGGSTGHKDLVPHDASVVLAAGQASVEVDAATGKSTVHFAAADAVTEMTVEYVSTATAYAALLGEMRS